MNILKPTLPNQNGRTHWGNLKGAAVSLALSAAAKEATGPILVVTPDTLTAMQLAAEIEFFLDAESNIPVVHFPDRETLPYDVFSPHQDLISERLEILYRLPMLTRGVVIIAVTTLMSRCLPQEFLELNSFMIHQGERIDIEKLRTRLITAGYQHVSQVLEHGEFTLRGSIIDLFPTGSVTPYRIDLFDNDVDSIRVFDPDTQKSSEKITQIKLLPAREYPLTPEAITLFRQNWRAIFSGNPANCPIYQAISEGLGAAGVEYYLPLFFNKTELFFNYLPKNTCIIKIGNFHTALQSFSQETQERYEQLRYDVTRPLLAPEKLFLTETEIFTELKNFSQVQLDQEQLVENTGRFNFESAEPRQFPIDRRAKEPLLQLAEFLKTSSQRILFCAESAGRREALLELLAPLQLTPTTVNDWQSFINHSQHQLAITIGPLQTGLEITEPNIIIITESQLFGEKILQQRRRDGKYVQDGDAIIRNLMELNIGAPIVHIDHGVGRYQGLQTLTVGDQETEFLVIHYAGTDKLYVPVSSLHLINRYTGPDVDNAPLHKLGTDHWSKAKRKAAEKIRDVAAELLELHAKRSAKKGFQFSKPGDNYQAFAAAFSFEETPDQERAIKDTLNDMCSDKAMDRLICGDVGFGKTEVAMRAAFIAVENNKQVVVLVPTTLLAQQHYQTFKDRFADWPFAIEVLSRFKNAKEQALIIEQLNAGKIDIVIGTHKLIQSDIKLANLGLLIIDEEHRFGVKQKEKLKTFRAEVDILNLTATPIPRTLNMAMSGIRDLSLIGTPPARRLSVKTFVQEKKKALIREAVIRETMRGGQLYYLHNSVETIQQAAHDLQTIVPEIKLAIAHGQMPEKQLERVMSDFYHHRFNALVCTTIIESGIDIPTANTIIIDRADKLGLAQLHQLRGRVGRSHHQAYAYLLIPDRKSITADADKRLDAIATHEDLGAGFILATNDLEIRGAGDILGEDQSGQMQAIGFSLYMDLLERAVNSLKAGHILNVLDNLYETTVIELKLPTLIPENYVPDVHTRLILYKRIANAKSKEVLKELQIELIDRFGLMPQQLKNLFNVTEVKLLAQAFGIAKIEANLKSGVIQFSDKPAIDPTHLIKLIQIKPQEFKFEGPQKIRFFINKEITAIALPDTILAILQSLK